MLGCKRHFTTPIFCSPNSPCRAIAESLPESELCVTEYRKTAAHDRPVKIEGLSRSRERLASIRLVTCNQSGQPDRRKNVHGECALSAANS